jgi:hypothetical protein
VQLAIGLTLGLAGAFGVGKLLQGFLVQTTGRDPVTLIAITTLVIVVSVFACLWPARHATRLDPLVAPRHDPVTCTAPQSHTLARRALRRGGRLWIEHIDLAR